MAASASAALSITDPNCELHKYQQVIAFGRYRQTIELVATLQADVCPSKAKVQIVFKDFNQLPFGVKQNLSQRNQARIDGKFAGDPIYHLIPMPLLTQPWLSIQDQNLSLSRTAEHTYHFPLVTCLELDIKNLDSDEGLSDAESRFVKTVKEILQTRFPNASAIRESVTVIRGPDSSTTPGFEAAAEAEAAEEEEEGEMGGPPASGPLFRHYTDEQPRKFTWCQVLVIVVVIVAIAQPILIKLYSQR